MDAIRLLTQAPGSRILLVCTDPRAAIGMLKNSGPRPYVLFDISDRVAMRQYMLPGEYPTPMILFVSNRASCVVGLDLGCSTALVVVGELQNPSQLVARVLRPGTGQGGRRIPFICINY